MKIEVFTNGSMSTIKVPFIDVTAALIFSRLVGSERMHQAVEDLPEEATDAERWALATSSMAAAAYDAATALDEARQRRDSGGEKNDEEDKGEDVQNVAFKGLFRQRKDEE